LPQTLADSIPALTRSEINDDSNSAIAPMSVNMALPIGSVQRNYGVLISASAT
jgi:hypothetical protein